MVNLGFILLHWFNSLLQQSSWCSRNRSLHCHEWDFFCSHIYQIFWPAGSLCILGSTLHQSQWVQIIYKTLIWGIRWVLRGHLWKHGWKLWRLMQTLADGVSAPFPHGCELCNDTKKYTCLWRDRENKLKIHN